MIKFFNEKQVAFVFIVICGGVYLLFQKNTVFYGLIFLLISWLGSWFLFP